MDAQDAAGPDVPDDLVQDLYGVAPADFLSRRTALVKRLRAEGAGELARRITSLRKPTLSASIVNRLVHADETVVTRVAKLGDSMRAAQDDLEVALLRDLSEQRRRLVAELAAAAVREADGTPSSTVREEVGATLEAAVADPEVLAALGRLVRPQRWSGFGLPAAGGPTLTLVAGSGRRDTARRPRPAPDSSSEPEDASPPAPPRRAGRVLARAQAGFDEADAASTGADDDEAAARERVSELAARLAEVTAELEQARRDHETARKDARAARTRRREARSALDRALRNAET